MEIDLALILQTFFAEAEEQLLRMEEAAVALEVRPDDPELPAEIFRVVHTIKGNAASLGLDALAALCHETEEPLARLLRGEAAVTPDFVAALLSAVDALRRLLREAAAGQAAGVEALPPSRPARTLRVDLGKLDRLLDLTGEIAVARGRLAAALASPETSRQELLEIHAALDPLHGELQERVTELRLVAVGPLFRQQIRTLRDLAQAQGKLARLVLEGEEAEVDASVAEHLRDPLTHLVRNALDHGIEAPEERRRAGKDPCGRVTLRAYHASGHIVVEVEDDGAGPGRARIEARVKELGLAPEPERLADGDLYRLVFDAGFSTAEAVTGVSGRGVGLDVVRRKVDALRGSAALAGRPGQGTTVTLRLPLTLAIIDGLAVGAGGETFVLPLDRVVECVAMPEEERGSGRASGLLPLRGSALPYLRLSELFGIGSGAVPARENVVVVETEEGTAGIAVDAVHGKSQTVIKPLGRLFQGVQGISGSAVLGNGRVALILDVPALLREAVRREAGAAPSH